MTCSQPHWTILLLLLIGIHTGCVNAIKPPSNAEILELQKRLQGGSGVTPKRDAPITADGVQVVIQTGHASGIRAVAVSPNGRYIASGGEDGVKIWDVASGQEIRTITAVRLTEGTSVAFTEDSAQVITAGENNQLNIFDVASGKTVYLKRLSGVMTRRMDPEGHFATAIEPYRGGDTSKVRMRVIDLRTGTEIWTGSVEDKRAPWVISRDGKTLLALIQTPDILTQEIELIVWDVPSKTLLRTLPGLPAGMAIDLHPQVSPDGRYLLAEGAVERDPKIHVFDLETGQLAKTFAIGEHRSTGLRFSSDGKMVAFTSSDGTAKLLEFPSGREVKTLMGSAVNFSSDGRTLVVGAADGGVPFLSDLASGKETRLVGGSSAVTDLVVTPDGRSVVAGMEKGNAKLWDLMTGQLIRTFDCPGDVAATSVAVSSVMPVLATRCGDGSAWLWDLATGRRLRNLLPPSLSGDELPPEFPDIRFVRMSRDGRTLFMNVVGQLVQWDLVSGKEVRRITISEKANTTSVASHRDQPGAIDPDVRTGRNTTLQMHPYQHQINRIEKMKKWVLALAIHPDGQLVAVELVESTSLWNLRSGKEVLQVTNRRALLSHLVFSPDGRFLIGSSGGGSRAIWDVATGQPVRLVDNTRRIYEYLWAGGALSPDGRLAASVQEEIIYVWDVATGTDRLKLVGHTNSVKTVAFAPNGRTLISGGSDGAVRVWDLHTGKEQAALVALGHQDFVVITPDQYYRTSKANIRGVAFGVGDQLYPFEQFDLRFNRPDLVLSRLGLAPPELIQSYRLAYEKRLKKMGFTEQMLKRDFHLPEVEVLTKDVPVSLPTPTLTLRVKASDSEYPLDRLHVFVNDIPIYGTAGLPLPAKQLKTHEQDLQVPLVAGRNKVQVSVLNQQGVESLKQTVYTSSTAPTAPPDVYVVAIGVSDYKNKAYSLRYAAKDALDLVKAYQAIEQRPGSKTKVHVLNLTDQKATRPEILKAKDWLRQSKINDLVVVFAAGHGMTDEQSNYYFGTHDIDPQHPATSGLPYEDFENLLDGIPALQKVLLLDTCFSGEIEKDQAVVVAKAETGGAGTVKMRAFKAARGVTVTAGTSGAPTGTAGASQLSQNMVTFQQDWFADLRRGTGAAVISSSSGNEYSLEGEQWKNGVFTYALLNGLKNHGADANKDQTVTVSELQGYVIDQVRTLTQGGQNPTVRHENLEYDFAVY